MVLLKGGGGCTTFTKYKQLTSVSIMTTSITYNVFCKGEKITFTSDLTSEKVYEILVQLRSNFAQDLAAKFHRLSEKQYAWAVKLAQDHLNRQEELSKQNYKFEGIILAIQAAQNVGMKRIKLRFWDVIVKPSKYDGKVYVLSAKETQEGAFGPQPKYLGWITSNATSLRDKELIDMLENVAEDPFKAAQLHGMETGSCACCGRELTNKNSIRLGIGPICATKFGWLS